MKRVPYIMKSFLLIVGALLLSPFLLVGFLGALAFFGLSFGYAIAVGTLEWAMGK